MNNKYTRIKNIIFPSKKTNITVISILILGVISGALFSTMLDLNDKNLIINKIESFVDNINTNTLNNILVFKNSILSNLTYSIIIWILGMTLIGVLFNIFFLYTKGFIFGFSLSSFIITYNYKGIILSTLYTLFGQLLNLIVIMILTIYSIMFTINFIKQITKKNTNVNISKYFKNYTIILLITLIISLISSLLESFIFPTLIKIIIKLFI